MLLKDYYETLKLSPQTRLRKGDRGEQGTLGEKGLDGVDGIDGKDGRDGQDGKDGKQGLQGEPGERGLLGKSGLDGEDGVNGKNGKDAISKTPAHKWIGTKLQFQNPDGTWGALVDLKGSGETKQIHGAGLGNAHLKDSIIPTGTIDGVNKIFTLPSSPRAGTLSVFADGVRQTITSDFTLSGVTVTFIVAPTSAVICDYRI